MVYSTVIKNETTQNRMAQIVRTETTEYQMARIAKADRWVPACGGFEVPYLDKLGRKVLYVYNHATHAHGYLDMGQDIVYETAEM